MAWTGKSGWFGIRFNGSTILRAKAKTSAQRRRKHAMDRPVEGLEPRLLLTGVGSPVVLSALNGSDGFRLVSGSDDGVLGDDVQNIGDMNGDGYDDLLVTSPVDEDRGQGRGQAYVIFGTPDGFPATITPSTDLDGSNGFVITADSSNDFVIGEVDAIGDFNADGFADLIVLSENDSTALNDAQIILGHDGDFPSRLDVRQLDGENGFTIQIYSTGAHIISAKGLGDVNGDGIVDVFVGGLARTISTSADAEGFVMYGKAGETFEDVVLYRTNNLEDAFYIRTDSHILFTASGADVNRDGLNDILVSAVAFDVSGSRTGPLEEPGFSTSAFVIYGDNDRFGNVDSSRLNETSGYEIVHGNADEDVFGPFSVGDLTDDGIDDLVIHTLSGTQVVPGSTEVFAGEVQLPPFGPENDAEHFYRFDFDFNADGIPDGITSTSPDSEAQQRIVLGDVGDRSLPENSYDLTGFDFVEVGSPASGETITGSSGIGDLNGDSFYDAVFAAESSSGVESLYVVFGVATSVKGNQLPGTADDDQIRAVSSGDVADALIGMAGDDTLTGNGGPDSFFGGPGNDIIQVEDDSFRVIDGGSGFDIFMPDRSLAATLDLTTIADRRLIDIEAIDLRNNRTDTLTLDHIEVLRLSSTTNTVRIFKDVEDVISMGDGWTKDETITEDWRVFDVYVLDGARLEVQVRAPSILPTIDAGGGVHIAPGDGDRYLGGDLSRAGDVNGDGFDDLLIRTQPRSSSVSGTAYYVVYGSDSAFTSPFAPLTDLNGANGFKVSAGPTDNRVVSVVPMGDFNADGYADLIVTTADTSAVSETASSPIRHQMHVVLGQADPFASDLDLSQLDGSDGFSIQMDTESIMRSFYASSPGDINGDGFEDVLFRGRLQSPDDFAASRDGAAVAYLLFGRSAESFQSFTLDDFDPSHGVRIDASDYLSLSSLKKRDTERLDINGDGLDDLVLHAWRYDEVDYSRTRVDHEFVVFGREDWPERVEVTQSEGVSKFEIVLDESTRRLGSFRPVRDVTGDGLDDFVAVTYGGSTGQSLLHTIPGSDEPIAEVQTLSTVDGRVLDFNVERQNTDLDFNGDGLNDAFRSAYVDGKSLWGIVLGSPDDDASGSESNTPDFSLATGFVPFDISQHEVIYLALDNGDIRNLSDIGDFNGDGYDDLAFATSSSSASVYVLFGSHTDGDAVLIEGTSGDDQLTGSGGSISFSDLIVGLAGDDTLSSNGGYDTLLGGAGDDVFRFTPNEYSRAEGRTEPLLADGGNGFDTLLVDHRNADPFFRQDHNSNIQLRDIEAIDLRNSGSNLLRLDAFSVIEMTSSANRLRVYRDNDQDVWLGPGWTLTGMSAIQGQRFEVWQNGSAIVDLQRVLSVESGQSVLEYGDGAGSDQEFTLRTESGTSEMVLLISSGSSEPQEYRYRVSEVAGIRFDMQGGNDRLILQTTDFDVTVSGGDGDDSIVIQGVDGPDNLLVETAASIDGFGQPDFMNVSAVENHGVVRAFLLVDGVEDVQFELRDGDDLLRIESFARASTEVETLKVDLGDGDDLLDASSYHTGLEVDGGGGRDYILTGTGNDSIDGGAGRDTINAGAGDDLVYGSSQDDSINGGAGNDTLIGDSGNDHLDGGAGDDSILGLNGDDAIYGGDGDDIVNTGNGADSVYGGDGADWMIGHVASDDWFDGGEGNDTIGGLGGHDTLLGSGGNDSLLGASGHDWLDGGDGDDLLFGDLGDSAAVNKGNDTLYGGAGNDDLAGGRLADELHGGDGDDTLRGDNDNDVLYGDGGRDLLMGLNGDDQLSGGDGDDTLKGGQDQDTLFGDDGHDFLEGHSRGNEELNGGAGNDTLRGLGGNDTLRGNDGDDSLEGHAGNDVMDGGAGDDMIDAGGDDDTLTGGTGRDTLLGGAGIDRFFADDGEIDMLDDMLDEDALSVRDESDTVL